LRIENVEDVLITVLAGFQALRARRRRTRDLYRGLAFYLLFLSVCAALAQYLQSIKPTPTGTLRDFAVDSAVSCFCDVGGEMAAQSRSGNWLGIAAEDLQRIDADERHIRARAV